MTTLSIFTPPGHRAITGREPIGKRYYDDKVRNYGADVNFPDDEYLRGKLYADAMMAASVHLILDRVKAEIDPLTTQTFLPLHEWEMGLVKLPGETDGERRAKVSRFRRLRVDGKVSTIDAELKSLLGDDLVFYRTTRVNELRSIDRAPYDQSFNYPGRETPIKVVALAAPVVLLGTPVNVPTTHLGGEPGSFDVGQTVLVDAGRNGRAERVVVEAVSGETITATFTQPHDKGAVINGGHQPRFTTTKRMHHVCLRNGAATDTSKLALVHELMRRLVKGTAIWQIMEETEPFEAGPFQLGVSPLGITPLRTIAS